MGWPPALVRAIWAFRMARVWILTKSGIDQAQAAAAQTQHGVLLVHRLDGRQQLAVLGRGGVAGARHLDQLVLEVGQELVERRVDEPDHHGQTVHGLEDALEVALLEHLQLGHRGVEGGHRLGVVGVQGLAGGTPVLGPRGGAGHEDGAAHDLEPVALAEHVLGAAEADALGAVAARLGGLLWLVGVGPDAHAADAVSPAQHLLELRLVLEAGLDGGQRAHEHLAGGAVDADGVALREAQARFVRTGRLRRRSRPPARRSRPRRACRSGAPPRPRGRWPRRGRSGCPAPRPCRGSRRARSRCAPAPRAHREPPTRRHHRPRRRPGPRPRRVRR